LLARLVELSPRDASAPNDAEARELAQLRARSVPDVETLVGRHVLVLATPAVREHARANGLVGRMDATYVLLRELFGVDPAARVGRRCLFFPEQIKAGGWATHWPSLTTRYDHGWDGSWQDVIAHELTHDFEPRHPNKALFSAGFFEGWADFAQPYVAD